MNKRPPQKDGLSLRAERPRGVGGWGWPLSQFYDTARIQRAQLYFGEFLPPLVSQAYRNTERAYARAFRFLRQPSRPSAPRPEANSGSAAGTGVPVISSNTKLASIDWPFAERC
jgi:hypothetical protein